MLQLLCNQFGMPSSTTDPRQSTIIVLQSISHDVHEEKLQAEQLKGSLWVSATLLLLSVRSRAPVGDQMDSSPPQISL